MKKTACILEIQYLPPVQYFTKWLVYRNIILDQHENYQKGSYRNRCHLAGPNGLQRLSIPLLKGKHQRKPITEVRISNHENWPHQHWKALQTAYGKAPFFAHYSRDIRSVLCSEYTFLWDLNMALLRVLLDLLGLQNKVSLSGHFHTQEDTGITDLREKIHPKASSPDPDFVPLRYGQVFAEKYAFLPNLSIVDLLFCRGPESMLILEKCIPYVR